MELKYQYVILIAIAAFVLLIFSGLLKKKQYDKGKRISNLYGLEETAYYKRKILIYKIFSVGVSLAYIVAIMVSFILLATPYTTSIEKEDEYKRDIMLCMDVSTSVNELNYELVNDLKETVKQLKGERFGIVIFNTSAVMVSPLTDDYEYIISQLDELQKALEASSVENYDTNSDDFLYYSGYLLSGTLCGNEERGSSLIGDGLATSVYDFPDIDKDRKRIIIFSTDNDLQGTPVFSLDEAADICKKKNAVVYGIGTSSMYTNFAEEMRLAMEKTGGKFYMQEESGAIDGIVADINKQEKNLITGKTYVKEIPLVRVPIIIIIVAFSIQIAMARYIKL